nr:hypothetical protein [Tanacetum cinerariifolium]
VVALEAYDKFVYKELWSDKSYRYSFVWPLEFAQLGSTFGYKVALELSIGLARTELRFLRRQLETILSIKAEKPWRTYALSLIVGLFEPHVPNKKICSSEYGIVTWIFLAIQAELSTIALDLDRKHGY